MQNMPEPPWELLLMVRMETKVRMDHVKAALIAHQEAKSNPGKKGCSQWAEPGHTNDPRKENVGFPER